MYLVVTYLYRCALNTGDSKSDSSVVDLVVGILFEKCVRDLGQAEPLFAVHSQGHDSHAVQVDIADLGKKENFISVDGAPPPLVWRN